MTRLILAITVFYAALGLASWAAWGHSFYDPWCCSEQDCAPIPASSVRWTPAGWEVTLTPEQHFMVQRPTTWLIPFDDEIRGNARIRQSPDDSFHACVLPISQTMRCLYVPEFGA